MADNVNHPAHYGGKDNLYEAIKVIEAWGLGFNLGNCIKYISRAGKKDSKILDLEKARWYLDREITNVKRSTQEDTTQTKTREGEKATMAVYSRKYKKGTIIPTNERS